MKKFIESLTVLIGILTIIFVTYMSYLNSGVCGLIAVGCIIIYSFYTTHKHYKNQQPKGE